MGYDDTTGSLGLGDPQFNSGIAYLQTIGKLIENYHASMMAGNYQTALFIVESLFDEVSPRLRPDDIKRLKELQVKASNSFAGNSQKFSRARIRDFYNDLNNCIHIGKMRLVDRKSLTDTITDFDDEADE